MNKALKREIVERFRRYNMCCFLEHGNDTPHAGRAAFMQSVDDAVNRLPEQQADLIRKRYLHREGDYMTDLKFYEVIGISRPKFTQLRKQAFIALAKRWDI
ncbi:hypothetical protein PA598K_06885 [Paenibacillus sp. 598K]|uniref:hypothetical protein n=1 Tax=Paenibacillus sp. 598K TaxID=1117987 RepID=UPI000FF99BF2|nr:hypothetical protein [Paenibacillus sp. 598K]GBF78267.1 hypothetical protein PA598K_06885 [Paenibacillus sp. 598K]